MCIAQQIQLGANIAIIVMALVYLGLLIFAKKQINAIFKQTKSQTRQQAWAGIFEAFDEINNYVSDQKDRAVYFPDRELKSKKESVVLLYHHLNLIFRFWINRDLMDVDEMNGLVRWMNLGFFQWILHSHNLCHDLKVIIEFKDLYPEGFISWFIGLPKYAEVINAAHSLDA